MRFRPFWYLRRRADVVTSEVDEELNLHIEMRAEGLRAQGMAADTARREAIRQFGDLQYTRRYCRQQDLQKETRMQRGLMFDELRQDLRVALRSLRRAPVMAVTIIATVGLGIGATTTIFTAINAALLRPLPYHEPERLVRVYTDAPPVWFRFSAVDYLALEAQQTQFERVAAYTDRAAAFSDGVIAERVRGREVTWTYFGVLGIRPAMGRDFTESDGRQGSPRAVLVSHGFWQRRLAGRADIAGQIVRLDGREHTVVGVLPQRVGPLEQNQEFFVAAQWPPPPRRGPFLYTAIARLREGVDIAAATGEVRAINRRIFPLWRTSYQDDKATWSLVDLKRHVIGDVSTIAAVALAAVALVWLLACANASNLLIARAASRRRELAIRSALGASRGRVVRYLLVESGMLALGAAALGGVLAVMGIQVLRNVGAAYFPRTSEITFDTTVLGLLAALMAASALLCGLLPALHSTSGSVDEALRSSTRSATANVGAARLRRALVGSQFAIATPLLIVAALLAASLNELRRVDLGFDTQNVLTGTVSLPAGRYVDEASVITFWDEFERRVRALPGVAEVAFADGLSPDQVGNFNNFDLEESPTRQGQSQPVTPWVSVSPAYFRLLGLTLLEGRLLDERDARAEQLVSVVVDQKWARRFFPSESAIGKRFRGGGCTTCEWTAVVGVVSDVDYNGLENRDEGAVYTAMPRETRGRYVLLRTHVDAASLGPSLLQTVRELDPSLPLSNLATIDDVVARSLDGPRSLSLLIGSLAVVALMLSVVGIYGVMSYNVQQQAKDISIRLALGASRRTVLRLVLSQGMAVVAAGVVIGLIAASFLTRLMASLLFGVSARDLTTFTSVSVLLCAIALLASLMPARRAVRAQPAVVLRNE